AGSSDTYAIETPNATWRVANAATTYAHRMRALSLGNLIDSHITVRRQPPNTARARSRWRWSISPAVASALARATPFSIATSIALRTCVPNAIWIIVTSTSTMRKGEESPSDLLHARTVA